MAPVGQQNEVVGSNSWSLDEEIRKNEYLRLEDVKALRDFSTALSNVHVDTAKDEVIVGLLHSCDYDLDRAREKASKYFGIRTNCIEVFNDRDVDNSNVKAGIGFSYITRLPKKSPEGCVIISVSVRDADPSRFNYATAMKTHFLTVDACVHEEPTVPGFVFVYDATGFSTRHLVKMGLLLPFKMTKYIQDAMPLKLQRMHFVNSSSMVHKIVKLVKPVMRKELYDILHFHPPDEFDKLWEHVPKECLPKDYGGYLPDIETLNKDHIEWLRKIQPKVDSRSGT